MTAKTATMANLATATAAADLLLSSSSSSSINSATGRLFKGEKIRTFDGERRFAAGRSAGSSSIRSGANQKKTDDDHEHIHCTKWNVVTTIFEPSEAVRRASKVEDWCTVIVADGEIKINEHERERE